MKKFFAIILCVIVLASFPLRSEQAHAIGPGLMIAGSTVINGSIAAMIASIVAQPMGLVDQINAAAEAAGVRAVDHLESLLRDYATSAQVPITSIYTLLNAGVMYAANGAITLSEDVSEFFGDFFSWAHSEEGGNLQQYDQPADLENGGSASSDITIAGVTQPISFATNPISSDGHMGYSGARFIRYNDGSALMICNSSNTYNQVVWGDSYSRNLPYSYTYDSKTVWYGYQSQASTYTNVPILSGFNTSTSVAAPVAWTIVYGELIGDSSVDTTVYEFSPGSGYDTNIVYAGDVVTIPDFGDPNQQGTADIAGWLGGVSDVIYTGGGTISVTDDQGVTADYGMTKSGVDDMQITKTAANTVDQVIGGSVAGVGSGTIQGELADYTLDLRDFFPFCVPFDIYRMLSLFAASREAPHVEWRFLVPGLVDQTIDIDLSVFDNVAATLRSVELIAAAIGLALITKRLIQGGD